MKNRRKEMFKEYLEGSELMKKAEAKMEKLKGSKPAKQIMR